MPDEGSLGFVPVALLDSARSTVQEDCHAHGPMVYKIALYSTDNALRMVHSNVELAVRSMLNARTWLFYNVFIAAWYAATMGSDTDLTTALLSPWPSYLMASQSYMWTCRTDICRDLFHKWMAMMIDEACTPTFSHGFCCWAIFICNVREHIESLPRRVFNRSRLKRAIFYHWLDADDASDYSEEPH